MRRSHTAARLAIGLAAILAIGGCVAETPPPYRPVPIQPGPIDGPRPFPPGPGPIDPGEPPPGRNDPPPFRNDPPPFRNDEPRATCNPRGAMFADGRTVSQPLLEEMRRAAGAAIVRVLPVGAMVTQEYRGDRLNVTVDTRDRILDITCG